jgi:hypothetical protein
MPYLRKRTVCLPDALLLPLVGNVVDAPLDVGQLTHWQAALQPLDVERGVVLQVRLLLDDGKGFHFGCFTATTLDAEIKI